MRKKLHLAFSSVMLVLCNGFLQNEKQYKLKQVLILSRHNLRTPLAETLSEMTPYPWPQWKERPGYLTAKGSVLEGYMGAFFSEWLKTEQILPAKGCPNADAVYIYANVIQRAIDSAVAFTKSAFPGCNVTVHHSNKEQDPTFNTKILNNTAAFKNAALEEMSEKLATVKLKDAYEVLEKVLDYKNSSLCKVKNKCDLVNDENKINVEAGLAPEIKGPIKLANSVADAFIMEYFEGLPLKEVAWGRLTTEDWHKISRVNKDYHSVKLRTSLVAKDIARPLIGYIRCRLRNENPKMILLMGHDSNIYSVLKAMDFKPYSLPDQYEDSPIGGKIVFQKWYDEGKQRDLLKINLVYQTNEQLRDCIGLSLSNPPHSVELELSERRRDSKGFCDWGDFMKIINDL